MASHSNKPRKLKKLKVMKVDLVDRPSNRRSFLVVRRVKMPKNIETLDDVNVASDDGITVDDIKSEVISLKDDVERIKKSIRDIVDSTDDSDAERAMVLDALKNINSTLESVCNSANKLSDMIESVKVNTDESVSNDTGDTTPDQESVTRTDPVSVNVNLDLDPIKVMMSDFFKNIESSVNDKIRDIESRIENVEKNMHIKRSLDVTDDKPTRSLFAGVFNTK